MAPSAFDYTQFVVPASYYVAKAQNDNKCQKTSREAKIKDLSSIYKMCTVGLTHLMTGLSYDGLTIVARGLCSSF